MKKFGSFLLVLMMAIGLVGCSGSDSGQNHDAGKESKSEAADMKAAVILGLGGLGDQSYSDLVYSGL